MSEMDTNRDGVVDFKEFQSFMEADAAAEGNIASAAKENANRVMKTRAMFEVALPRGKPHGDQLTREDVRQWATDANDGVGPSETELRQLVTDIDEDGE
jgi:hypothetical protein